MPAEFFRYIVAGSINTFVGYAVFLGMFHLIGISVGASNLVSYIIGLSVSYFLNMKFVFRSNIISFSSAFRFFIGFIISYMINCFVLFFVINYVYSNANIAQIFAMAAYTITFYLINKFFVCRKRVLVIESREGSNV